MLFTNKQIDRVHHLITEHGMNAHQVADILGTNIRNAYYLIRLANQKYAKVSPVKRGAIQQAHYPVNEPAEFTRPKAEYSNVRIYDLV
jgi:hypothetical protein